MSRNTISVLLIITTFFLMTRQTPTNYFLGLPINATLLQIANEDISNLTSILQNNFDCSPPQNNLMGIFPSNNNNQHVGFFDVIKD